MTTDLRRPVLVAGDDVIFAATGATDGARRQGVRYAGNQLARTQSVVKTGTVRIIEAIHDRDVSKEVI